MQATKFKVIDQASKTDSNLRIYSFLKSHPVGVLTTVDPNGEPHGAVIYYYVSRDFTVTFTTKRLTKKSDNLRYNNHAMLFVYEKSSQTTAQITGYAKLITDPQEAQQSFDNMLRISNETSIAGVPSVSKLYAGNYVAFKVKALQIRMTIFAKPEPGNYDTFETVDFIA